MPVLLGWPRKAAATVESAEANVRDDPIGLWLSCDQGRVPPLRSPRALCAQRKKRAAPVGMTGKRKADPSLCLPAAGTLGRAQARVPVLLGAS